MSKGLPPLTDEQLRVFLSQVRTHDLIAYLKQLPRDEVARILDLLSPASAENVSLLLKKLIVRGNAARAKRLLESLGAPDPVCAFCKIIAGEAPASMVYRDDAIAVFMDLYPVTSGHMLVVPIRHSRSLQEVAPETAVRMMQKAQELGRAIMASDLGCDGYNLFMANGGAAGQEVFHAHLHILPRHHGDGFGFVFPPPYPAEADRKTLDAQATMLKSLIEPFPIRGVIAHQEEP